MRQQQRMTMAEVEQFYQRDIDRAGYMLDDEFLDGRGLALNTVVRFTTDSTDHFDGESLAEIQADC